MIFRSLFSTRVGADETAVRSNSRSLPTLSFSSFRSISKSKEYRPIRRFASADFVLTILLALLIGGCGESTSLPSAVSEAAKTTPEQEFLALQKKAEGGDAKAQFNLGLAYLNGKGVPEDSVKAVEWLHKAAAQGDAEAQHRLGYAYDFGRGVSMDKAKSLEWYRKSADQGNAKAQSSLGHAYYFGEDFGTGVPKDVVFAMWWYQQAAAQGHAHAQYSLGEGYRKGEGVSRNDAQAVEWYQKAAAQGNDRAQYALGTMYDNGQGVPKDSAKAMEWWLKAAAQGEVRAWYNLGVSYGKGEGVATDNVLAYAWLNLSAVNGIANAGKLRDSLARRMTSAEIAEAQNLSSNRKAGQSLTRESSSARGGKQSSPPGSLAKKGTGTVFVVGKSGHAITNKHVTDGCVELRIEGRDGVAKHVTEDAVNDLALIRIPGEIKAVASIANDPAKLRQGEDIVVFGFPLNSLLSSGGNLTPGVVSAMTGLGNNTNQIQITAPIQPGSSGSSVLNKKGEVVGVVSMKLSDSKMAKATGSIGQNVNFAVSGQTLKTFLDTHKVEYRTGGLLSFDKNTADLADEARKWTLVVECWR